MNKTVVIAFGGNALLRAGQKGTYAEQLDNVYSTCEALLPFIKNGYNVVIGHGNGPQVGNVLLQHSAGKKEHNIEAMPMDFCVAETQGSIAYLIEQNLQNLLNREGINKSVVSLVTRVVVDAKDPAFENPTKPVGPYYTKEYVDSLADGAVYAEDPKGNGWRKVVASPRPLHVNNIDIVKKIADAGNIVITVGGGGIPVYKTDDGKVKGVEAVIDKDLASAVAAIEMRAEEFYIFTDVPKVCINFRKENEQSIDTMTVAQAKTYLQEGQFTEGSMAPKVRAAIYFVENGGEKCTIAEASTLNTLGGTVITK